MRFALRILWLLVKVILCVIAVPFAAVTFILLVLLMPRGVRAEYLGKLFSQMTLALWHWVFGPPRMRIHHSRLPNRTVGRRRFGYGRN